jgi:hypothetical protein
VKIRKKQRPTQQQQQQHTAAAAAAPTTNTHNNKNSPAQQQQQQLLVDVPSSLSFYFLNSTYWFEMLCKCNASKHFSIGLSLYMD